MRYRKIKVNGVTHSLHKYIWEQAHGPVPDGHIVHHINHDKLDNRLENLTLMTHAEHSAHHNNRYPREKVCEVCGTTYEPLPTKRKRSKTCSEECLVRLLSEQRIENNGNRKINRGQSLDILTRLARGEKAKDLAEEYGVSAGTIYRIKKKGPNLGG